MILIDISSTLYFNYYDQKGCRAHFPFEASLDLEVRQNYR